MLIKRLIVESIKEELQKEDSKVVIIYGARQVGKTTLVEDVLQGFGNKVILRLNGDKLSETTTLSSRSF